MSGLYDPATGGIRTTTVSGSSWTGLYASDGSLNIVIDDTTYKGLYHPCGALRVNSSTGSSVYDSTGAQYYNHLLGHSHGGWLSAARYNAGGQFPAVIADHRRKLYAVPQLGPELVTNGTFDTDTSAWTAQSGVGLTWSAGKATSTFTTGNAWTYQQIAVTPGKLYRLKYDMTFTGLNGQMRVGSGGLGTTTYYQSTSQGTGITAYFTAADTSLYISFGGGSANPTATTVDNISLQEVMLGDVGAELVNQANWQTGTAGGTSSATNSPQGTLTLTCDGTNEAYGQASYATTVGQPYTLICNVATALAAIKIGATIGAQDVVPFTAVSPGIGIISFVATSATTWVKFARATSGTTVVSNISLRSWTPRPTLRSATFDDVYAFTAASTTARTYKDASGIQRNDLAANQPRYDWMNGVSQLALNNAATNLILQSQALSSANWLLVNGGTAANNAGTAPDGTNTASLWSRTATSPQYVQQSTGSKPSAATLFTYSVFVKKGIARYFAARLQTTYPARADAVFDLDNGVVSSVTSNTWTEPSATMTALGNGWYRCTLTATSDSGTTTLLYLNSFNNSGGQIDTTDTSATSSGYMWGMMSEQGATFASPYIPTTTAAVTRAIETCEHSPLVEAIMQRSGTTAVVRGKLASDASTSTRPRILGGATNTSVLGRGADGTVLQTYNGSTSLSVTSVSPDVTASGYGAAVGWDASGRALSANGKTPATDTNSIGTLTVSYLGRGGTVGVAQEYGDGWYDEEVIFASKLTNSNIQAQAVPYAA